jgi:hypothetical protein
VTLCRPYGDPDKKNNQRSGDEEIVPLTSMTVTATQLKPDKEQQSRVDPARLDWDFESCLPFQWNAAELGLPEAVVAADQAAPSKFLGSTQPNGWSDLGVGVTGWA